MDSNDPTRPLTPPAHDAALSPAAAPTQCDECHAPVDAEQRYCVVCGAHRRHVDDPAARYLSQASARRRTIKAASTARRAPRGGSRTRGVGVGVALALALIPVAAVVGVLAGRASNNDDAALIRELSREQASANRTAATTGGGSGTSVTASTPGSGGADTAKSGAHRAKRSTRGTHHKHASTSTSTSTKPAAPISTKPATAAQKQSGAKVTQKVQKSTGKKYVNGQSGLPGTVVVP